MAGKNKVERGFRILVDDSGGTPRDLCSDLVVGSVSGGGLTFDQVDVTGVCETVRNYLAGQADAPISASFHMNDTATTGATTVLNGIVGSAGTVTLQWGENGNAPATGDPEWEGEYLLLSAPVSLDGNKFVHQVSFVPSGSTSPAWGTVA